MIYLASPYNNLEPTVRYDRYRQAVLAAAFLLRSGECVFSPIVHNHPLAVQDDMPRDLEFWLKQDSPFLHRAQALYVLTLDGWRDSRGVRAEVEIARGLLIPIKYMTLLSKGRDFAISDALPAPHFWDFALPTTPPEAF